MELSITLNIALLIYFVLVVFLFISFIYLSYTKFSSFVLAIIIGFIFLMIAFPMTDKVLDEVNVSTLLYMMVIVLTITVLFVYTFLTNFKNRKTNVKFPFKKKN